MIATDKQHEIEIPLGAIRLPGLLFIPKQAKSLVIFVHGSGSSRLSTRNQFVAHELNRANHATLLFDLLTSEEDVIDSVSREFRFNIELLATRLLDVTRWCNKTLGKNIFSMGYFGASTGAGAALEASAQESQIKAVVSRGGRPDLADNYLPLVQAPTLLIVGGKDRQVIELNQTAMAQMTCVKEIEIVQGASHLFEELGTLEEVAFLAKQWFGLYLINRSNEHDAI